MIFSLHFRLFIILICARTKKIGVFYSFSAVRKYIVVFETNKYRKNKLVFFGLAY